MSYFSRVQNSALDRAGLLDKIGGKAVDANPNRQVAFKAAVDQALLLGPEVAQAQHDELMDRVESRHNPHTVRHAQAIT
ncbi:hypothetical protein K438DRAFT_1983803 [Mycena galopus ATCC 62051]|nr:hypothetical protein K438DRAFT_1983803 [Mycena galopus ATCC 62051]